MKRIIVTTTNSVEGSEIIKYLGIVSNNVVLGTNIFSDLLASLSDIFGGTSGTYQKKLREIYDMNIACISEKAKALGANGIVGVRIDFDEISGGGKSMFMASIVGTAVVIQHPETAVPDSAKQVVGYDELSNELTKRGIINLLNDKKLPTKELWNHLFLNPIDNIAEPLLALYTDTVYQCSEALYLDELNKNLPTYMSIVSKDIAIRSLYGLLPSKGKKVLPIIEANKLFSAKEVINLLQCGEIDAAISVLSVPLEYYTSNDVDEMKTIADMVDSLPMKGGKQTVKGGMLSKEKEKYICPNGHANNAEYEFCKTCGKDAKGLTESQWVEINTFKRNIQCIEDLFAENRN